MNKGDTAVLSAHVRKEKQTDVIWKSNGERGILAGWASKPIDLTLNTSASSALAPNTPVTPIHLLPALANLQGPHCSGPGAWDAPASISISELSSYCTQRTSSLVISSYAPRILLLYPGLA